jgi:hypothetical protein
MVLDVLPLAQEVQGGRHVDGLMSARMVEILKMKIWRRDMMTATRSIMYVLVSSRKNGDNSTAKQHWRGEDGAVSMFYEDKVPGRCQALGQFQTITDDYRP